MGDSRKIYWTSWCGALGGALMGHDLDDRLVLHRLPEDQESDILMSTEVTLMATVVRKRREESQGAASHALQAAELRRTGQTQSQGTWIRGTATLQRNVAAVR